MSDRRHRGGWTDKGERGNHRGRGTSHRNNATTQNYPPPIPDDRTITLITNTYPVEMSKFRNETWYRYEVSVTTKYREQESLFEIRREIIAKLSFYYPDTPFAFDGDRILYVRAVLEPILSLSVPTDFYLDIAMIRGKRFKPISEEQKYFVDRIESDENSSAFLLQGDDEKFYKVLLRKTNFNDESRTQLLQMALSFSFFLSGKTFVRGHSFFHYVNGKPLGDNWAKVLYTGSYQSFRQVKIGTILNIDLTYYVSNWFGNLLEYVGLVLNKSNDWINAIETNGDWQQSVSRETRGLQVLSNINKRKYRLSGVDFKRNCLNHFFVHEGVETSVVEYMLARYNYRVKFPQLGLAFVAKLKEGFSNDILLPLECLSVIQTRFQGDLSSVDRRSMIEQSRCSPKEKLESIKKNLKELVENKSWQEFNVDVETTPLTLKSVVLPPQALVWSSKVMTPDEERGWIMGAMHSVVVPNGVTWGLIWHNGANFERVRSFAQQVVKSAEKLGLHMAPQPIPKQVVGENDGTGYVEAATALWNNPIRPTFTIVLLPERDNERYKMIKNCTDVQLGMITKCLVVDSERKWTDFTIINSLLASINNRINGKNWIVSPNYMKEHLGFLPSNQESLCVMGLDVCHGRTSLKDTDSTVALCASKDTSFCKYHTSMGKQDAGIEIVESELMESMVLEVLVKYKNHNKGMLPSRILFYRDGVGEGQYGLVEKTEVSAIKKAFLQLYPSGKTPLLTYLIVQKRNHLRAFRPDESGNVFNPPVGTLIANHIIDTNLTNFYLYSHKAIVGTARPTHYQVLINEIELETSKLAEFTFALAHLHQGCTKTVSVPAPAILAHKAAYRANAYFGRATTAHPAVVDNAFMI